MAERLRAGGDAFERPLLVGLEVLERRARYGENIKGDRATSDQRGDEPHLPAGERIVDERGVLRKPWSPARTPLRHMYTIFWPAHGKAPQQVVAMVPPHHPLAETPPHTTRPRGRARFSVCA